MTGRIRRIRACLNGGRSPDEHPAGPATPAELAAAAEGAVAAGAEAVHVHPRAGNGAESLAVAEALAVWAAAASRAISPPPDLQG